MNDQQFIQNHAKINIETNSENEPICHRAAQAVTILTLKDPKKQHLITCQVQRKNGAGVRLSRRTKKQE